MNSNPPIRSNEPPEFQKFKELAVFLVSVPKEEIKEKMKPRKRAKSKKSKRHGR